MATLNAQKSRLRRQLRWFVLIWTVITIIMGACTFFAIFVVLGETNIMGRSERNIALPTANAVAVQQDGVNPTGIPTIQQVAPTIQPTPVPVQQAAPPAQAPTVGPTNTPLPVSDKHFQVAIQVQASPDLNPDNQDGWMREVSQKLGLGWFKQQVRWEEVEPQKGQYDWSVLDMVIGSASKFGLKVLMSIVTAPKWAREPGADLNKQGPPANNADYVNFVSTLLNRYPKQVQAIEVWNEENIDREWSSTRGLKAANYVSLLKDTFTAVKAIDPGVIIISGALSPTGFNDGVGAWDDYVYLDQLISAGVLNYADCIGVHHNGYNIGPNVPWNEVPNDPTATFRGPFDNAHHSWSFYSTLNTYANKVAVAGGEQKLCVTEFGWASTEDLGGYPTGFEFANDNTLKEQADWTIEALNLMDKWGFVWLASIWNFNYGPQAGWAPDNDNVPYSIIGKDWKFRPVYDAIIAWSKDRKEKGLQ
jgi:polysaccharide biosynthesis protein PslG